MPKRNDKRDTAKAEYVKRRRSGEKINLKEFAAGARRTPRATPVAVRRTATPTPRKTAHIAPSTLTG